MATLAEQLSAARKAAGMTQEELSAAVHVARNTISSWEHGRTQPDLETLRLLGQILHTDFLNGGTAPETAGDAALPKKTAEEEPQSALSGRSKKHLIVICTAVLAVIAAAVCLLVIHSRNLSSTAKISVSPLKNPAPMIADADYAESGLGWEFTFVITNESDVPFRPEKASVLFYKGESIVDRIELDYDSLRKYMENDKLTNSDLTPMHISWGANYPRFTSVELIMSGTDDHGHDLQARTTIELSQEKPQQ